MKQLIAFVLLSVVTSGSNAQDLGQWRTVDTKNSVPGRNECGLAAVNGRLYLLGGDQSAASVEVFNPETADWTKKALAPVPLHHFQPVALGDKVYVLEAFYTVNYPNQLALENAYCYDTKADRWLTLAGLPPDRRRAAAGAAAYKGKLYLVAGIRHGHSSGTTGFFDEYDPLANTWKALPDAPHIRDHSCAVVVGDKLYALGGRNTSYHEPGNFMAFFSHTVQAVDCYDFSSGTWSTLRDTLPQGTGGGTAVNFNETIYYIGGERATATTPNAPQNEVYAFDPAMNHGWKTVAPLHSARNGVGGAVLQQSIYIAGGASGPGAPPGISPERFFSRQTNSLKLIK